MRSSRSLFLFLLALIVFGCSDAPKDSVPVSSKQPLPEPVVQPPKFNSTGDLALRFEDKWYEIGVRSAMMDQVLSVRKGASAVDDLPAGLSDPFRCSGWRDDAEGFAVISYENKVALIQHTVEHADGKGVEAELEAYTRRFSRPKSNVTGDLGDYWFWDGKGVRLMLCAAKNRSGDMTLTVSVGIPSVMDALKMTPEDAERDVKVN